MRRAMTKSKPLKKKLQLAITARPDHQRAHTHNPLTIRAAPHEMKQKLNIVHKSCRMYTRGKAAAAANISFIYVRYTQWQ